MINLLPPEIKSEIAYSKRNAVLRHYIILVALLAAVLSAGLFGAHTYLAQKMKDVDKSIAENQLKIASKKQLEAEAQNINSRLTSISNIQKSQAKFSVLLDDLARDMPRGTAISTISLTGDDTKPVKLTVTAVDYNTALGFRDSITSSPRISAADIESIKVKAPGSRAHVVTVTFTFNPGQAR